MIKAAIFDMDGLLIDSEPLWQESEIAVLTGVGVPLTEELCRETTGMRIDRVILHWYKRYPWQGATLQEVESEILSLIIEAIIAKGEPMPGATELVHQLSDEKYQLAIASSSPLSLITAVLEKLSLSSLFSVVHSAEYETQGKPDPAVYRSAVAQLEVASFECVAFEDSVSGVISAKDAGTFVIAVPAKEEFSNPAFAVADLILESLADFSWDKILNKA